MDTLVAAFPVARHTLVAAFPVARHTLVAAFPVARHSRVSAVTGLPDVSIMGLGGTASSTSILYPRVAALM